MQLLQSEEFWVLLAFVAFGLLLGGKISKGITAFLDAKRSGIKQDIERAEALLVEAEETLAANRRRLRDSGGRVDRILAQAHSDGKRMREDARRVASEEHLRQLDNVALRGRQLEAQFQHELGYSVIDVSINVAAALIGKRLGAEDDTALIKVMLSGAQSHSSAAGRAGNV